MNELELLGISEIAQIGNVSRQAVANWRKRYEDFPSPAASLAGGPVWHKSEVEMWLRRHSGSPAPEVVAFVNMKGGVGKTTLAVAAAEILAHEERRNVLVVDLDPQTNSTICLIPEQIWAELNGRNLTMAGLFKAALREDAAMPEFDIEAAIKRDVSDVAGGIKRLDLFASSVDLIGLEPELAYLPMKSNFQRNPLTVLSEALDPVKARYDFIIIDCPPSLGLITRNGLWMADSYVIPTVPDILSTTGIFQVVKSIDTFARETRSPIHPAGIVINKYQEAYDVHRRIAGEIVKGRLFPADSGIPQPPAFATYIKQSVAIARGAEHLPAERTLRQKYGEQYTTLVEFTKELLQRCNTRKK